ncbi:hypothetical protein [Streptomyces sp. NPDC094032]|uniref:hypothetical protein n=1 Tax=Streptomyces sp. NPDC094032 TaxID=3155308 RepID=UPI00331F964E
MPPEPAPTPAPSTDPSTPPNPAPTGPPAAPPSPPAPAPAPAPTAPTEGDLSALPEWAQERIRAAEAAKEQAPPAPPAPEPGAEGDTSRLPKWAQQQLAAAQEQAKTAAIQAAVLRVAPTAGGNVSALLDSRAAMTALAAVDPNDPAAVTEAIKAAVQAQPHLAVAVGPARGGADFGTATPPERRPGSLHDAIAARLGA